MVPPTHTTPVWYFGGIDAADYIVNYAAAAGGLNPNWNGSDITWKAILSNSTVNARDRINLLPEPEYIYTIHGDIVSSGGNNTFWNSRHGAAIEYDESGNYITDDDRYGGNSAVWTGTRYGEWFGFITGDNRDDPNYAFEETVGNLHSGELDWSYNDCCHETTIARLYGISPVFTVPGQPGDINGDGVVDTADYVAWRKNYLALTNYNLWRAHYGQSISGSGSSIDSATVPEPSTLLLLGIGAISLLGYRKAKSNG